MEHQSFWPDHTQGARSQPRSLSEPSVGSVHSQDHLLSSVERPLSTSITRLAFCMGFLGSLVLLFMGVQLYDSFSSTNGSFHLVTPVVDDLLLPLSFLAIGVLSILRWKMHLLSKQLSAVRRQQTPSQTGLGWLLFLSPLGLMGLFFIFAGAQMIWWRIPPLAVILAVGSLSFLGIALFFSPARPRPSKPCQGGREKERSNH